MNVMDIETDGLLDTLTKIHCASVFNTKTKEWMVFIPDDWHESSLMFDFEVRGVSQLPAYLDTLDSLCCHNGIGFDLKVLKKLYNYTFKGKYRDTLLMSRILWPDLESPLHTKDNGQKVKIKGPHSVESWGIRLGLSKPEHNDWSTFSHEMLNRNMKDSEIQGMIYEHIEDHIDTLSTHDKRLLFQEVFDMEQRVWGLIEKQADYGWLFDVEYAFKLVEELEPKITKIDEELIPQLPIRCVAPYDVPCKAFTKSGELTASTKSWLAKNGVEDFSTVKISGDFSRVSFERMNLNADKQVKDYLLSFGWKPKEWNVKKDRHNKPIRDYAHGGRLIKTSPKLPKSVEDWEEVGRLIDIPAIKLIAERNKAAHRLSSIRGWIKAMRVDGRVEAQANTCSANTTRFAHKIIVNVPKAEEGVYYGKEMRSLFIVPDNKVLVGIDASALEARCEAHYIYPFDKDGAMELIDGDIHSKNALIFQSSRGVAKGGKYCLVYGGSAKKLAQTLGKPTSMGEELYEAYWNGNPGLKKLKQLVEAAYRKWGYLLSIDKRPLTIRYKHALINTLFQSCGSIIMKIALCIFEDLLERDRIIAPAVGNFHDEFQREANPDEAEQVGILGVQSIKEAAILLEMNVPFTGEYKIGRSWSETH